MKTLLFYTLLCSIPLVVAGQKPQQLALQLLTSQPPALEILDNPDLLINRIFTGNYYKWGEDSIMTVLLPLILDERDSLLETAHNEKAKTEIQYYFANGLSDLSGGIRHTFERWDLWKVLADSVSSITPLPNPGQLAYSPSANQYLHNYMGNELRELFLQVREHGEDILPATFGLPIDSLKLLAQRYGETYLTILFAKRQLPPYAAERYMANQLLDQAGENNLMVSQAIRHSLAATFPGSPFLPVCDKEIAALQNTLTTNTSNGDIIFVQHADSITSLPALLYPFRGKVVYLDIWGTWCGPCVIEITQYTKAVKERFKGRDDLVFLYLAMDRDEDHEKWEQFIRLKGVTGYHMRKTDMEIEPFWVDLLQTKNTPRTYPTYAIFDRDGKLVTAEAMRPSNGETLYSQLDEILNR